jgi:hypothetical protein
MALFQNGVVAESCQMHGACTLMFNFLKKEIKMSKWKDGTSKSTNNAFTGFTNSIDWTALNSPIGAVKGGLTASKKNGTPVYLPNSEQVRAYTKAGVK